MTDSHDTGAALASTSGRRRRLIAAGLVGTAAIVAAVWFVVGRGGDESRMSGRDAGGAAPMADMPGMSGLPMSVNGSIALSASQIRQFGITFGSVEERTLESTVRATGAVSADEARVTRVSTKVAGFVERLYVATTGQLVRAGQPLLELYSPDLVAAQEDLLLAARLTPTLAKTDAPGVPASEFDLVAAARRRLALLDMPAAQIDEVLRTGRARRTVTLHSPANGVVVDKAVVDGAAVAAGAALYTIADLSRVWVDVDVRETDAAALRRGTRAMIDFAALPGRRYGGTVELVYPTIDAATRSVRSRIAVANTDGALLTGMFGNVQLIAPSRRALTVPTSALVRTGERTLVFADLGGGRLAPQTVEVGRTAADFTEVLSGAEPGQRVVTSAQYLLESESNLADVMRSMMGQTGSGDMGSMPGMEMKGANTKGTSRPIGPPGRRP